MNTSKPIHTSDSPANTPPPNPPTIVSGSQAGKEMETPLISPMETIKEISGEIIIPPEVERAGVKKIASEIELPPDVRKLGVTPSGAGAPVITTTGLPQVNLPISDPQVLVGLHAQVTSALAWLALWCIRKLKKAHIALKTIHGKIIRVKASS